MWSDQLRKANAVNRMSYGKGIVGMKYPVIDKAQHLIKHLEEREHAEQNQDRWTHWVMSDSVIMMKILSEVDETANINGKTRFQQIWRGIVKYLTWKRPQNERAWFPCYPSSKIIKIGLETMEKS